MNEVKKTTYKDAGVDIDAGDRLVSLIKPLAKATIRPGADASLGGFGALFDLKKLNYKDPILVSGTDGVGTKLKIAHALNNHTKVGIDLVAMSVNDLIVQGAEPIFFLDYYACSKLNVETARDVIAGIAEGCKEAGCALIGGETAEMPGMYQGDEYDLAGFAVGVVERNQILPKKIEKDDVVLGIGSSGLHSNGFSLVRRILGNNLDKSLLEPTRIYIKSLLPLIKQDRIKALVHITGGGLVENPPRVLPDDIAITVDCSVWKPHDIFLKLAKTGNIEPLEMLRTFNCGIGMIAIVNKNLAGEVKANLEKSGEKVYILGEAVERDNAPVIFNNLQELFK